ncbi:probable pre-mRNA-splicing factor ATP-dependent RNA helicase DEAH9 [Hibiscus syriacus]|uniref:probable pre-mRNA-splicing factor ATP-dependent RNA helicase DEAH9 n=1 Tax=Hibiscus syriacus TaxID=106335 RepID=UPI001923AF76|nr:probable pre-mRNA-splicing factor ATP-dependent RNA helicase DEAH9 [Hibiscus syriacus]
MAQFWKPGTEKPRLLEDEDGGVVFLASSFSLSSSGYGYASIEKQRQRLPVYKYRTAILYLVKLTLLPLLLVRLAVVKPLKSHSF